MIDLGVLLVLGSMSLPFVTAAGWGQRAVAADALPALLLVLPIFVITLLPDHSHPLPAALGWISLFLAATALPYTVIKYLDASTLAATLGGNVGMGARLLVVGAFVILAGLVLGLVRRLLGLPAGGTYPAGPRPEARSVPSQSVRASSPTRDADSFPPAPATPAASIPGRLSTGDTADDDSPAGPAPPPEGPSRPAEIPPRPVTPPPRAAPADDDTEPTLPGVERARRWWPDDLEDLFS